ncbi:hypothetical protein AXE80_11840 [Wenyingzhuangia fucanilytica]|uniref:DUF3899 domain-containing protein n=1 Tax=Wenyingzhuangia fucanilytica TaxID=1790137 RepID=A0A1B1Y818_9FLAO|nr:hypothetical protein [Wenyingzhuangia fucanilytica]ANW96931.1 hypothetical protein AXE80_11840 [Wenyingzhuangia fucanilytica]
MKLFNFTRVVSVLALFVLLVIYISTGGLSDLLEGPDGEDLVVHILVIIPFMSFGYVLTYTFLHENWYKYGFYFNKKENDKPTFIHKILHKKTNKEDDNLSSKERLLVSINRYVNLLYWLTVIVVSLIVLVVFTEYIDENFTEKTYKRY